MVDKKKIRIAFSVIMLSTIHPHVSAAMSIMLGVTGKKRPDIDLDLITPSRIDIASGRNMSVKIALDHGCKYIYFQDDDTICPPDTVIRLVDRLEKHSSIHAISPMYRVRTYPYKLMGFVEDGDPNRWKLIEDPYKIDRNGLIPCVALGNGCTMFRMKIFEDILKSGDNDEFFRTAKHHTEDAFFAAKARTVVPKFRCAIDSTFSADHMLGSSWLNEDTVDYTRVKAKLMVAVKENPDRLKELKALVDGWMPEDLPLTSLWSAMDYDGSLGRM